MAGRNPDVAVRSALSLSDSWSGNQAVLPRLLSGLQTLGKGAAGPRELCMELLVEAFLPGGGPLFSARAG